jgi:hypothetical protein
MQLLARLTAEGTTTTLAPVAQDHSRATSDQDDDYPEHGLDHISVMGGREEESVHFDAELASCDSGDLGPRCAALRRF